MAILARAGAVGRATGLGAGAVGRRALGSAGRGSVAGWDTRERLAVAGKGQEEGARPTKSAVLPTRAGVGEEAGDL